MAQFGKLISRFTGFRKLQESQLATTPPPLDVEAIFPEKIDARLYRLILGRIDGRMQRNILAGKDEIVLLAHIAYLERELSIKKKELNVNVEIAKMDGFGDGFRERERLESEEVKKANRELRERLRAETEAEREASNGQSEPLGQKATVE